MPYVVQFIGLACFGDRDPSEGGKWVLLPDGRFPRPDIRPHYASISVRTEDLIAQEGWYTNEVTSDGPETEFWFQPSRIVFSQPEAAAPLDASTFDPFLNSLLASAPQFTITQSANWIAAFELWCGSIAARNWPGYPMDGSAPILGEWTVPHDGEITIHVTARKGWPRRTIVLRPGSEIALINMSRGVPLSNQPGDHFEIYGELSSVEVHLQSPALNAVVPESPSRHPWLLAARPAGSIDGGCSPVTP